MSFFEAANSCALQEYVSKRDSRLGLVGASAGELIILMLRLESAEYEAAKIPAMINSVRSSGTDTSTVDISIIDNKLAPIAGHEFAVQNDFIKVNGILRITINGVPCDPTECYARDYFEEMMPPNFRLSDALELVA